MRELKFRAWDKKEKRWLGVNLHMSAHYGCLWWQFGYGCEILSAEERDNIELVQYTGRKDKRGVDIYYGDRLQYKSDTYPLSSGVYLISWCDEECGFVCERQEPYNYLLPCIWHECEIISNIYEDPEFFREVK